MRRVLLATLVGTATLALVATAPANAAPAEAPTAAASFAGTVALSNCSGSVVKLSTSQPSDPALVLSNGHCLNEGFPAPGEVVVDQPSTRSFTLLDADAGDLGTVQSTKIVYSTMTDTDVSLYQLSSTYEQIEQEFGITALELASDHPAAGASINVISGYWKEVYSCAIDGFVHELHEGDWVWKDSIRYTPDCHTIGGTSGSPIVDAASGKVIGVNNTGNEDGQQCTVNNPCEVDEAGNVTVHQDINYGEETYLFYGCMAAGSEIDLSQAGCALPKPAGALAPAA